MADYVVKLNGQDNLSPTLNNVKNALNGLSSTTSGLDKIQEKFAKIENSSAPLKRKLKDIQGLMAQLNMSGDSNSPIYNQMAQAAGRYKDAIADASDATKRFASDTMSLEAGVAALQGVAAAGTIATGVMGLFGTKNEEVERAILKVQSALAILNGVQSIANILNKDSVLIQKLKQIRIAATTVATSKDTIATTANTTAQVLNTTATKKDTIAQTAWNTAKAIGKALMGDFTGLVLVGIGAVATYAIATSDATDKIDEQNKALDKGQQAIERQKERMKNYSDTVSSSATQLVSSFMMLQSQWKQLSTDLEKNAWIKKNEEEFRKLGLSIKSVTDAENIFINNSKKVVGALMLRASQDALADLMKSYVDDYVKSIQYINGTVDGGGRRWDAIAGKEYGQNSEVMRAMKIAMRRAGDVRGPNNDVYNENNKWYTMSHGNFVPTEYGAKMTNQIFKEEADARRKKNQADADNALTEGQAFVEKLSQELKDKLDALDIADIFIEDGGKTTPTTPTTPTTKSKPETPKPKTDLEIYRDFQNQAREIQEKFNIGLLDADAAKKAMDTLNSELTSKFGNNIQQFELDLKIKDDAQIYKDFESLYRGIQEKFNYGLITEQAARESIDTINKQLEQRLGPNAKKFMLDVPEAEAVIDPNSREGKRQQYEDASQKIDTAISDLDIGLINYDEAKREIQTIIDMLHGIDPNIKIKVDFDDKGKTIKRGESNLVTFSDTLGNIAQNVGTVSSAFGNLGKSIGELTDNEDMAKAALVGQAIGQLALSFASAMKGTFTPWDWIAAGISGAAVLTSLVAQLQSFAGGGVVMGGMTHGDHLLARVNAGEMILNGSQQDNLFRAIDENRLGGNGLMGKVEFEIDGRVIKGVLNNYDSKMKKIK